MNEQVEAARLGISVRVYRLQEKLRRLPLMPRTDRLRKARNEVTRELVRLAREDRCVPKINLMAGTTD